MARAHRDRLVTAARVLGFAGALAIVAAVAVKAIRDAPPRDLDWPLLIPAVAAALGWWVLLARGWALLMSGRWTRTDAATWCRTQALRYLPGGIWAPASRLAVAEGGAADRLRTVAAENIGALVAGLAVGGLGLALAGRVAWAPLVLAPLAPALLARVRLLPARAPATVPTYLAAFAGYAIAAILAQAAVSGWHDVALVAGAAGIAWAAGLVVIVAPSGLGVREVVYVGLLAEAFGKGEPAAGAVVLRLVTIVAELVVLIVTARALRRREPANG
ncbi:MAG: glycosyltransferase 2 family protein [Solirubrobacteraceae bacterium]|nr:glycosyltransferase 2 family protein [Solirubrobacteraceae bacterium]